MNAPDTLQRWTLPSGLTLLHLPRHAAPVVAAQVWVGVGSADELPHEAGLAHVHEHMLFKGTSRFGVGEIARRIEGIGGSINAWTSFDETVYYIVAPSRFATEGLDVLLDAVHHSTFDADELERELEVIREEIARGEDMPARVLSQSMFSTVYRTHPYGLPVIGSRASVSSFTRDHVVAFFERWYHPSNMTLVVVGDMTGEALRAAMEPWASIRRPGVPPRPARAEEPEQRELRPTILYRDVQNAQLEIAFPGVTLEHEDAPALEVLCTLLGGGDSAVLFERLVRNDGVAVNAWGYNHTSRDSGIVAFGATFAGGAESADPFTVVTPLVEELAAAAGRRFRPADIDRAIRIFEAGQVHQAITVQGLAQRIGTFEALVGDPDFEQRFLERTREVTPDKLQDVARRYLRPERATVGMMLHNSLSGAHVRDGAVRDLVHEVFERVGDELAARAPELDEHGVLATVLPNGMKVYVQPDPTVPAFAAQLALLGGQYTEPEERAGLHAMLAHLLTAGTSKLSASALAERLDELGAEMSGTVDLHSVGLAMSGMSRDFDASMDLFGASLFDSVMPQAEIERVRREMMQRIRQRRDNLAGSAFLAFHRELFGEHPAARPLYGEMETVGSITREDLVDQARRLLRPEQMVLVVVGDVDPLAVVDAVARWEPVELEPGEEPLRFTRQQPAPRSPGAREVRQERDRQQAHLVLGYPGLTLDDPDRPALAVLSTVLNGQGGRLFVDLRDRRSLAYSVGASTMAALDAASFSTYIATSRDKIDEAVRGMREHLQRLRTEAISDEELSHAKRQLVGRREVATQRLGTRAARLLNDELYGFGYGWNRSFDDRIMAVSAQDILRVAERLFQPEHEVLSIIQPVVDEAASDPNGDAQ
mgnify:FL=1